MIGEIMRKINNFFIVDSADYTVSFSEFPSTITFSSAPDSFKSGQYIKIDGSILNDGVYKIVSKSGNNLILEEDIVDEANVLTTISSLAPPKDFLTVCKKIEENEDLLYSGDVSSIKTGDTNIAFNGTSNIDKLLMPYRKVWFKW